MATITISNTAYNHAKDYAEAQNIGVDELIVMLIDKLTVPKAKKRFDLLPYNQLEPQLQEIINMPAVGQLDSDDENGEKALMDYYKEKYKL